MSERQKVELRDNGSFQNEVYNLCSFIFLAPERDVDLSLKAEDSTDDDVYRCTYVLLLQIRPLT